MNIFEKDRRNTYINMDKPHHHIVLIGILCLVTVAYCAGIISHIYHLFSCVKITNYGDREPVGFLTDRYCYFYNIRPHKFIITGRERLIRTRLIRSST